MKVTPEIFTPGTRTWIVGPTYDLANKIAGVVDEVLVRKILEPRGMIAGRVYRREEQLRKFTTKWGSEVVVKQTEDRKGLVGDEVDALVVTEAAKIKRSIWEKELYPVLATRQGWAYIESTPEGRNWFYELHLQGRNPDDLEVSAHQYASWTNPNLDPKRIAWAKARLAAAAFQSQWGAKFVTGAGAVYAELDAGVHLFERGLEYDPRLPTVCGIDFGYRMPAVVWFQIGGTPRVRIIDAIVHEENVRTPELGRMILAKGYDRPENPVTYWGDPSGEHEHAAAYATEIATLEGMGIRVGYTHDPTLRDIPNGVQAVQALIRTADGATHLGIDGVRARDLFEDLESYAYPERKTEEGPLTNRPKKDGYHDHGADALRYAVVNQFPELVFEGAADRAPQRFEDAPEDYSGMVTSGLLDQSL